MSVPDSSSPSPWMAAAPEVQGNAGHSPKSPSARTTRAGARPPQQRCALTGAPGLARAHCPNPTQALWHTFNMSNKLNTMHQTYRTLDKHLGQISDDKSTAGGRGAASKLVTLSRQGTCSQLFLPITSAFFKLLHTVVALW